MRWVDEDEARELVKQGVVGILRTKRRVRALQMRERIAAAPSSGGRPGEQQVSSARDLRHRGLQAGSAHSRETKQNPRGVWTINRLPSGTRRIFLAVVEDCLAA